MTFWNCLLESVSVEGGSSFATQAATKEEEGSTGLKRGLDFLGNQLEEVEEDRIVELRGVSRDD